MKYLYLIKSKDRFKIGYTTDYKKRFAQYKTHNLDLKIEGIVPVKNKEAEKYIHWNLLKQGYKRCKTYKEWFEGTYSLFLLRDDIKKYYEKV